MQAKARGAQKYAERQSSAVASSAPASDGYKQYAPFTPDWNRTHRKEIIEAAEQVGVKIVTEEELDDIKKEKSSVDEALKNLGIQRNSLRQQRQANVVYEEQDKLIDDIAKWIDLVAGAIEWRDLLSRKQRNGLHWIRTFIRQLRAETPPPNQARHIADLMQGHGRLPMGTVDRLGRPRKPYRLTEKHLEAAGILPSAEEDVGLNVPSLADADDD